MNEKTASLEAEMLLQAKLSIAQNRSVLDLVDTATRRNIAQILGYSDFGTDGWLISACSYLGGETPLEVLKTDSSRVIRAAIHRANWRNPG